MSASRPTTSCLQWLTCFDDKQIAADAQKSTVFYATDNGRILNTDAVLNEGRKVRPPFSRYARLS
jgi:hypothetical protein